ncbi:TPA_inf: hypothetical protein gp_18 [Marinomonas phage YY]|nr:TPA_inf: hypothetical protein gp_18 [Marinomonas phage YY]
MKAEMRPLPLPLPDPDMSAGGDVRTPFLPRSINRNKRRQFWGENFKPSPIHGGPKALNIPASLPHGAHPHPDPQPAPNAAPCLPPSLSIWSLNQLVPRLGERLVTLVSLETMEGGYNLYPLFEKICPPFVVQNVPPLFPILKSYPQARKSPPCGGLVSIAVLFAIRRTHDLKGFKGAVFVLQKAPSRLSVTLVFLLLYLFVSGCPLASRHSERPEGRLS